MNLCFLLGKVISNIIYEFLIGQKETSIAIFSIELKNGSQIVVKGYDEIADYCYQRLKKDDKIWVKGSLLGNGEVKIEEILNFV